MQVLLGGLITLAITAVVQIVIIPWVQRRSRARERWEKDVLEMESLLQDELPSVLRAMGEAGGNFRNELWGEPDDDSHSDDVQHMLDYATSIWNELKPMRSRFLVLRRRLLLIHPYAPSWKPFSDNIDGLVAGIDWLNPVPGFSSLYREDAHTRKELLVFLYGVDNIGESDANADLVAKVQHRAAQHGGQAYELMREIGFTMKPPKQSVIRRWRPPAANDLPVPQIQPG
jgi:hypothetical protein